MGNTITNIPGLHSDVHAESSPGIVNSTGIENPVSSLHTSGDIETSQIVGLEVFFSKEALLLAGLAEPEIETGELEDETKLGESYKPNDNDPTEGLSSKKLTKEEKKEIEDLKKTDREVRQHERAHAATAGNLVRGGVMFRFEAGPDGKLYAVGGEVQIDISPVKGDPAATIRKAQKIKAAALAPHDPSAPDRMVAAKATSMANKAAQESANEEDDEVGSLDMMFGQINQLSGAFGKHISSPLAYRSLAQKLYNSPY